MALLEAQAAGLPVVAGRSGGVPSVVADGETGLLAPEGDAAAFAEAVGALLADPERRARDGAGGDGARGSASTTSPSPPRSSTRTSAGSTAAHDPAPRHPPRADRLERGRADPGPHRPPALRGRARADSRAMRLPAEWADAQMPFEPARSARWRRRRCSASIRSPSRA